MVFLLTFPLAFLPLGAAPEDPATLPAGKTYVSQEEKKAALLRAVNQKNGEYRFKYGMELLASGLTERGVQVLEDFIVLYPGHAREFEVRATLARSYWNTGRLPLAEEMFQSAYELDPASNRGSLALVELGRMLLNTGKRQRAIDIFEKIMLEVPETEGARIASIELNSLRILDR